MGSTTGFFRRIFDGMPSWLDRPLSRPGLTDFDGLYRRLSQSLGDGRCAVSAQALRFGQNTFAGWPLALRLLAGSGDGSPR